MKGVASYEHFVSNSGTVSPNSNYINYNLDPNDENQDLISMFSDLVLVYVNNATALE